MPGDCLGLIQAHRNIGRRHKVKNRKWVAGAARIGPDMRVNIGGIAMKNPVMAASGTFGYGREYAPLVDLNRLGALVVKGISLKPAKGNETPRMVEVPSGLINAIGLQN